MQAPAVFLVLLGLAANAQTPLAKPLAEFDKLVAQLKTSCVVGEPIRAGDTSIVPFAKIQFDLAGGEIMTGVGGGLNRKTVPLGILIVEGDDVRAELFPEQPDKPAPLQEMMQAIRDRKFVFMVNGLNIGNAPGSVQDLAPLVSALMGQTTVMVQGLNLGNLSTPRSAENASLESLTKLYNAKNYVSALKMADALIAKDSRNADFHAWRGRVLIGLAHANPADMMKHGMAAREEIEKALALDPDNPNALLARGVGCLLAPAGYGGDMDAAIADFERVIAKKPSSEAYSYLGEAFKNKGLQDKSAAAFKKALDYSH